MSAGSQDKGGSHPAGRKAEGRGRVPSKVLQ
jgi:hypothetical protein